MEAAGLALAVLPAFSLCLEYFQLYKTARATSRDSQILLFKFDCEHESFIIWGEKHGVLKPKDDEGRNPELEHPDKAPKISKALGLIHGLLSDAAVLRERYGVGISTDPSDTPPEGGQDQPYLSSSRLKRLKWLGKRLAPGRQGPGLMEKIRWAINDKDKFQRLIEDIRDLVKRLYKILPVAEQERNNMAIIDIRSLARDLEMLTLFEKASIDAYPAWSGAASVMREAGSTQLGPGTISQWMDNVLEDDSDSDSENEVGGHKPAAKEEDSLGIDLGGWSFGCPFYFVFTSTCPTSALGFSCDMDRLEIRHYGPAYVFEDDRAKIWGLGERFSQLINPKTSLDLEQFSQARHEVQEQLAPFLADKYPLAKVKILCPPCRCAVRTALLVCNQQSSEKVEYKVSIDDRMPVSCCLEKKKLQRLRSLVRTVHEYDGGGLVEDSAQATKRWLLRSLDRVSLEQRIYRLETELYDNEHYDSAQKQFAELLAEMQLNVDGIPIYPIYLCEASSCARLVQKAPFPWSPRVPKESEIFKFKRDLGAILSSTYLGTYTSPKPFARAAAPAPLARDKRKDPRSLRSSDGALDPQLARQGRQLGTSPNAGDMDPTDLVRGEKDLDGHSESAGSGQMDTQDTPDAAEAGPERAAKRYRQS